MVISESSRQGSVVEEINKFMGSITMIPLHQLFLGPQYSPNPISDFRTRH